MKTEDFVDAVQAKAIDGAVKNVITLLNNPPGRDPSKELLELSRWYLGLAESDRETAGALMSMVARGAIFGLFTMLDGSSKVEPFVDVDSYFELRYVTPTQTFVLCGPSGGILHELM